MTAPRDNASFAAELSRQLSQVLGTNAPVWLEARRWFADKGRGIARIEVVDLRLDLIEDGILALVVARLTFIDGEAARYFLPLVLVESRGEGNALATIAVASRSYRLVDATEQAWFGRWLLAALAGERLQDDPGWTVARTDRGMDLIALASGAPAAVLRAEQSNTTIRFGDELVAKLIRRLQPAPNPEEEMLSALTALHFPWVPALAASASWRAADGARFPIALAQAFVPNQGDGWSWTLDSLVSLHRPPGPLPGDGFVAQRRLGQRTAELHLALSQASDLAFVPEPADAESISQELARAHEQVQSVIRLLQEREATLPAELRTHLGAIIEGIQEAAAGLEGFRAESGYPRIRVHGDYHLGQTLRTLDDDWMMIDFEGEPARPVYERRQKSSALKDVAGMVRSFAYVRGAAERARGADMERSLLDHWEQGARAAFLSSYRATLNASGQRLVPEGEVEFMRALRAWELSKALYEIGYEVRNRPDWLALPIRALLPDVAS